VSFGLFVLSTIVAVVSFLDFQLSPFTQENYSKYLFVYAFYLIFSFISQCLLCMIFWVLSKTTEENERVS